MMTTTGRPAAYADADASRIGDWTNGCRRWCRADEERRMLGRSIRSLIIRPAACTMTWIHKRTCIRTICEYKGHNNFGNGRRGGGASERGSNKRTTWIIFINISVMLGSTAAQRSGLYTTKS